jgi:adhesin/invasin
LLCGSASADVTVTVDQRGNGTLVGPGGNLALPAAPAADPGPGGLASVLSYGLLNPPDLVFGDVQLLTNGVVSQLIRFVPAGTGNPNYAASLLFYAMPGGSTFPLVPTATPPSAFYPNVVSAPFGSTYTPGPGQPGYVSSAITHYTFNLSFPPLLNLNVVPSSLTFMSALDLKPPDQLVTITGGDGFAFTVSVDVPWATVTPSSGQFPTVLTVKVNPAGLALGATYPGNITVNSGITTVVIPITYISVTQPPPPPPPTPVNVTFVPNKLVFTSAFNVAPPNQTVASIGGDGTPFTFSVDVPWAVVTASSTQFPTVLTVKVGPGGLTPGSDYGGTITVKTANTTIGIPIAYIVGGQPSLVSAPDSLTFNYVIGGPLPPSQQLTIFYGIPFTAAGTGFVSVTPGTATTTQEPLTVTVDPSKFAAGTFNASVVVTAGGVTNSPLTVPVTLNVTGGGPQFNSSNVVNAASFQPGPMAPGSLFTIFGSGLASASSTAHAAPGLPTSMGGVSMTIGGIPVPLEFVSSGQINAQVPFEVGMGTQTLVLTSNGISTTVQVTTAPVGPGTFVVNGRGAILNQDYSLNGSGNGALTGSTVQVYFTGQGRVSPPVPSGMPASLTQLSLATATVTATIGSQPAPVTFSGLAPGFIGLGQANVQIPSLPSGDYPLVLTVNGVASNPVTVAVRTQ